MVWRPIAMPPASVTPAKLRTSSIVEPGSGAAASSGPDEDASTTQPSSGNDPTVSSTSTPNAPDSPASTSVRLKTNDVPMTVTANRRDRNCRSRSAAMSIVPPSERQLHGPYRGASRPRRAAVDEPSAVLGDHAGQDQTPRHEVVPHALHLEWPHVLQLGRVGQSLGDRVGDHDGVAPRLGAQP